MPSGLSAKKQHKAAHRRGEDEEEDEEEEEAEEKEEEGKIHLPGLTPATVCVFCL